MLIEKINNIVFEETELKNIINNIKELTKKLEITKEYKEILKLIEKINEYRDHYLTFYWCSYIGYLKNIKDEKYLKSEELISKYDSIYNNAIYEYYNVLDNINNKNILKEELGNRLFNIAHNQKILLSTSQNVSYFKKEMELRKLYRKSIMDIQIEYNGQKMNLAKSNIYLQNDDRNIRKIICDKRIEALIKKSEELSNIFLELINVRNKYSQNINLKNYSEYGFLKMNRIGYTKDELKTYKENVIKYFVPLRNKLIDKQKERLNLEKLEYYDASYLFLDGNAKLNYDLEELLNRLKEIYLKIHPALHNLFDNMLNNELIDLSDNEFKSNGGITTYLPDFKMPIFIKKYLGLDSDYTTIIHEFGHSTQLYFSKDLKYHENRWPTFDICEIHSTTMELLLTPYAKEIFNSDYKKYILKHFTKIIDNIISTCAIDDFQNIVYSKELNDKEAINEVWKSIQNKYSYNNYDIDYFNRGISWQTDINRIDDPFYGIDYSLASICALSFYKKFLSNKESTIEQYIDLCKNGGQISFKEIISKYNLTNLFNEDEIKELSIFLSNELDKLL